MSKRGIIRLIIGSKKALTSGGWFTFKTLTFNSAFINTSLRKMSKRVERDGAYKVGKMKAFTRRTLSNRVE